MCWANMCYEWSIQRLCIVLDAHWQQWVNSRQRDDWLHFNCSIIVQFYACPMDGFVHISEYWPHVSMFDMVDFYNHRLIFYQTICESLRIIKTKMKFGNPEMASNWLPIVIWQWIILNSELELWKVDIVNKTKIIINLIRKIGAVLKLIIPR